MAPKTQRKKGTGIKHMRPRRDKGEKRKEISFLEGGKLIVYQTGRRKGTRRDEKKVIKAADSKVEKNTQDKVHTGDEVPDAKKGGKQGVEG